MILGVIGPSLIVEKFQIVSRDLPQLTIRPMLYETMLDAPSIAAGNQSDVDALYFSGVLPYFMAASVVQPVVPWFYLERPTSGLSFAFLEARAFIGDDVRFSIDTFTVDDGSGKPILVKAPGHTINPFDYARATGILDPTTNPPTLTSSAELVQSLAAFGEY